MTDRKHNRFPTDSKPVQCNTQFSKQEKDRFSFNMFHHILRYRHVITHLVYGGLTVTLLTLALVLAFMYVSRRSL